MAAAASSSQSVGRYAPGGPTAIEAPPRAASSAARVDPLSGPMNSPKRSTTVSPSNSSRALRSAVSAVVVTPPPATGASSSSHASPPSAYTNAIDSCTSRCTPAAWAARAIAADASVRMRSFSSQADGSAMRSALGMWVSRLTTASAPSNARRSDASSNTSASTARAPEALEPLAAARGARHARDAVAGGEQLADGAPPDDACGSGDHDLVHAATDEVPRSIVTCRARFLPPKSNPPDSGRGGTVAFRPRRGGRSFHEQPSRSPSPGSAGCPGRRAGRRRAGARHHGAGRALGEQQGRRVRRRCRPSRRTRGTGRRATPTTRPRTSLPRRRAAGPRRPTTSPRRPAPRSRARRRPRA